MSDPVTEEIKYSETLFDSLFDRIKKGLNVLCKSNELKFKGLWAFTYWEGANALQSIYFKHVNKKTLANEVIEEIEKTRLDCDYGSLGHWFTYLKKNPDKHIHFLKNTYDDAKGTVIYYDTIIGQQHACFVIIRNGEEEILGILDFFFEGESKNNCEEQIKQFFENNFYGEQPTYLTDFINAYKIRQFEDFIKLQKEVAEIASRQPDFGNELNNATLYIERLIAVSSKTPLMVIKHKNGNYLPELVSLNFDFIHSIIKHEHRFCPLTTEKNCFHFQEFNSFKEHTLKCDNPFLKGYYYDVFSSLGANLISQLVTLDSVEYTIELVCKSTYSHKEIDVNSLTSDLNKMKSKFGKEIAFHKYRDERVYMLLDNKFKKDKNIYAFSMARKVTPHLKLSVKCKTGDDDCKNRNQCIITEIPNGNLKQFLSPSTILPVQYEIQMDELLEKMESEDKNIVHFKIINEDKTCFLFELKKLIAENPFHYLNILKPYLNDNVVTETKKNNNLSISFAGDDPFIEKKFSEVIKGKRNLIEALLQEEEIKVQARKAAIAQVMLRNMSHNHGSHVLANLTQPDYILKMAKENKHENLSGKEKTDMDLGKLTYKNSDNSEIKVNSNPTSFTVAVAGLSSYMRTRMDFLADISTGTAVIETNKNLANDVIEPFENRTVLLKKFITGNEKKVNIQNPNGTIVAALPNDNLGVQAFYVIVENVIRNSAKHSKSNDDVAIYWKMDVNSYPDLIEVIIYDKNDQKEENELIALVNEQNSRIEKDMLDNGVLRHGSWGMLEMKIAAAYLRKIPVESIDKSLLTPLLTAVPVPGKNGKYLGYKFYLRKPSSILIVVNDSEVVTINNNDYENHGIKCLSKSELSQSQGTFGHDIVLLVDCEEQCIFNVRKRLSSRIVKTNTKKLKEQLNKQPTEFINWAWEQWFNKLIEKTKPVNVYKTDDSSNACSSMELGNSTGKNKTHIRADFVYHCNKFRDGEEYFEPYGSIHPARKQIDALFNSPTNDIKGRFLETINYTVAIADERIQKHSNANFDGGISNCNKKYSDFLEKCGVFLPPIKIDLNAKSFSKEIEENGGPIKQQLNEWLKAQAMKCNFLVIHIGIIERLLELNLIKDEDKQSKIETYLSELRETEGRKARFIITSGRGQPESLPKGERFIHYSNIAQYVIERRSKFHLIQLLMSARETK